MLASFPAGAQQERDWGGIERCAAIGDASARHACLDRELAALGLLEQATADASARAEVSAPVRARESAAPRASEAAANETITYEESQPRDPVISGMTSTVASARLDNRRGPASRPTASTPARARAALPTDITVW